MSQIEALKADRTRWESPARAGLYLACAAFPFTLASLFFGQDDIGPRWLFYVSVVLTFAFLFPLLFWLARQLHSEARIAGNRVRKFPELIKVATRLENELAICGQQNSVLTRKMAAFLLNPNRFSSVEYPISGASTINEELRLIVDSNVHSHLEPATGLILAIIDPMDGFFLGELQVLEETSPTGGRVAKMLQCDPLFEGKLRERATAREQMHLRVVAVQLIEEVNYEHSRIRNEPIVW